MFNIVNYGILFHIAKLTNITYTLNKASKHEDLRKILYGLKFTKRLVAGTTSLFSYAKLKLSKSIVLRFI